MPRGRPKKKKETSPEAEEVVETEIVEKPTFNCLSCGTIKQFASSAKRGMGRCACTKGEDTIWERVEEEDTLRPIPEPELKPAPPTQPQKKDEEVEEVSKELRCSNCGATANFKTNDNVVIDDCDVCKSKTLWVKKEVMQIDESRSKN